MPEASSGDFKASTANSESFYICSRGHNMSTFQKIIWVGPNQLLFSLHSTGEPKIHVVLITYPDIFTMDEAKSLVGSAGRTPVGVFTQKISESLSVWNRLWQS